MLKYYKTISIFLCIIICLLITGCTCVCKDKETIFTIQDYVAVNGETCLKYIEADTAIFDTISGDINIRGNVKLKRGSSITGSINYKEMN